jgi:hypothetical protein
MNAADECYRLLQQAQLCVLTTPARTFSKRLTIVSAFVEALGRLRMKQSDLRPNLLLRVFLKESSVENRSSATQGEFLSSSKLSLAVARKPHHFWCIPAQRIMAPSAVVTDATVADQPGAGIIRPDVTVEDAKQAIKESKRKKKNAVESVSLAKLFSLADTQDLVCAYCSIC